MRSIENWTPSLAQRFQNPAQKPKSLARRSKSGTTGSKSGLASEMLAARAEAAARIFNVRNMAVGAELPHPRACLGGNQAATALAANLAAAGPDF